MKSLIQTLIALGLTPPSTPSTDIDEAHSEAKITNPAIAQSIGATRSIDAIWHVEHCANLLDSFSESGDWAYLQKAQAEYRAVLDVLPERIRQQVEMASASAISYFNFERFVAYRIRRGDRFCREELAEYLLRRGADAPIYGILCKEFDNIDDPGLISGFRIRQGLWDLADDAMDLAQDKSSIGANILLLAGLKKVALIKLAESLARQARSLCRNLPGLREAIESQFEITRVTLQTAL